MSFDDFHDDTIDNSYPQPAPVQARLGETEMILRRTIDMVATAPSVPLSSTPRIDRDELIELLEDALMRLPEEIRQARWMLKERQEFLDKTKREADELLGAARQQAERMVQRTEVVRAAEARARQVIDSADEETRRLRNETEDFLDQRLGSFEILLDRLSKTVATGRHRLSIGAQQVPPEAEEPIEQQNGSGFFDQDIS
jgi:ABC-type transporter Mla subunit MlaD